MKQSLTATLPNWANWIAQDADGTWWAYEIEPLQYHKGWYENEIGRNIRLTKEAVLDDWQKTLKRV